MRKVIIGAPFGNYISRPGVLSTLGTYTYEKRAGFLKRLWRVLATVRYYPRLQSGSNKLGLPSPGIHSLMSDVCAGKILNIHGFNPLEWEKLIRESCACHPAYLELNLSCPNVTKVAIREAIAAAKFAYNQFGQKVIAKLPPIRWMDYARPLRDLGVTYFHLCNTIPTPGGGLSGKVLKPYSLWAVEEVKAEWNDVIVIGGGGINCLQDVIDFLNAGADSIAVASMLFNPLNWWKLDQFRNFLEQ